MQAFPLSDVKAFMGHADISTTMSYAHHVPQIDAADRLSRLVAAAESVPSSAAGFGTHSRHGFQSGEAAETETGSVTPWSEWARLDSNQGPTDYESAALTS